MISLSDKRRRLLSQLQQIPPSEDDPHPDRIGVLLSDEIQFYAQHHNLICPFRLENLKPAAYELTIGDEYFLNGEYRTLDASNDIIRIPPFEVSVLKTAEIVRLPRYIIARWNIKVSLAYSGLLWVGGPQVDPGWVGHLYCPIYNLSDKTATLRLGDEIAIIDFVKTTPFDNAKSEDNLKRYPLPRRIIIQDYNIDDLRSALFTNAGQKLREFEEQIHNLSTRFTVATQLSFAIFSLVISVIAIISKVNADNLAVGSAVWAGLTLAVSIFALLVVLFSNVQHHVGPLVYQLYGRVMADKADTAMRFLRRKWWTGLAASILLSGGVVYGLYTVTAPDFRNLRQQNLLTRSDLEPLKASLSLDLRALSERVRRDEQRPRITPEKLDQLRMVLEHEIQSMRSITKTP